MHKIRLGRTGLTASSVSFGALPLQRVPLAEAVRILRRAYEAGINFFDTARAYSDSEEKLGAGLADVRRHILIATKTKGGSAADMVKDLETSLKNLKTDYVDLWQIHNPDKVPCPGDGSGIYVAMLAARKAGKVRFIGLTNHLIGNAFQAADSGLYDTVQFPFSVLSTGRDLDLLPPLKVFR